MRVECHFQQGGMGTFSNAHKGTLAHAQRHGLGEALNGKNGGTQQG